MKEKNKGGRPKKYTPEVINKYAEALDAFAKLEPDFVNGSNIFLTEFCTMNGLHRQRLVEFAQENELFSDSLKKAKTAQETKIAKAALVNKCNPTFAIFALKNIAEWRDRQDVTTDGKELKGTVIYCPKEENEKEEKTKK